MTSDLHVILGASGSAGNAIARATHAAGLPTRAVSRSGSADLPADIEGVSADITDEAQLRVAVDGAAVVYMAAQPAYHRWVEEFPAMTQGVIDAVAATGAKLVMVDNLYMYGAGHDRISESSAPNASDAKGRVRRQMLEQLMEAHRSGKLRVAVGQASDYFGPRADNSSITVLGVAPVGGSGSLRWMGALDVPHSVAYLPDIARAFVTLGTSDLADGRAWVLPHGEPVTGSEFLDEVNANLAEPRKIGVVSRLMLRLAAPFSKISKESLGVVYQWTKPWIADDTAFQHAFGPFASTPLGVAVKDAVDWYRDR